MSKEAIEALEAARAHILDAYRIWQADDVSAVPPPKSGAGAVIAKIDAILSSPGKDGGHEVEADIVEIREALGYDEIACYPDFVGAVSTALDELERLRSPQASSALQTAIYRLCVIEDSPNLNEGEKALIRDWISEARSDTQPASTAQEVEAVKYEARICKGVPADCCDYGVVDLEEGIEVCRVWKEDDVRLITDLLNGTVWPEPTEDGDDLTECFRHHVLTTIGWQAFGSRPGPEMQMYEEGFKAGYRRCQSDNEPEFGEEEDELDARARKVIGRLRDSLKAGGVEQIDIDNAVDLIVDQAKALARPQPASTALVERQIRKAGQVAIDELIERMDGKHPGDDDLADYLTRIVDACARAALSASTSREGER